MSVCCKINIPTVKFSLLYPWQWVSGQAVPHSHPPVLHHRIFHPSGLHLPHTGSDQQRWTQELHCVTACPSLHWIRPAVLDQRTTLCDVSMSFFTPDQTCNVGPKDNIVWQLVHLYIGSDPISKLCDSIFICLLVQTAGLDPWNTNVAILLSMYWCGPAMFDPRITLCNSILTCTSVQSLKCNSVLTSPPVQSLKNHPV